jgi:nitrite reductase (NADH) small subunit/3-phenylpropionate/trans-cinnamate dioxygenase ferredoxin subunit
MPQRIHVGKVGEVAVGNSKVVTVGRKDIAVFNDAGSYFAIDDCCPHAGASLAGGHVEEGIVTCPWHAWRFRLDNGAWADNPRVKTGCYETVIDGDNLYISIPDDLTPPKSSV